MTIKNLLLAVTEGNRELLRSCIAEGIDLNSTLVVKKDNSEKIDYLFGGRPGISDFRTKAIILAAENGYLEIVEDLIRTGRVDPTIKDEADITAAMAAARYGHHNIVKFLIENTNIDIKNLDPEVISYTLCMVAAKYGQDEVIQVLIEAGANINAKSLAGESSLYWAIRNDHIDIVKILLKQGASIEGVFGSESALSLASKFGHNEILCVIINSAKEQGKLRALIESRDYQLKTPLMNAAENGHLELVLNLIENGANINAVDNSNKTALIYAAEKSHSEIVKVFVEKIAAHRDLSKINIAKADVVCSIFFKAVEKGHDNVVKAIIDAGLNPNVYSNSGPNAIEIAIKNRYSKVVKVLLNTNKIDSEGINSSFIYALYEEDMDLIKTLLPLVNIKSYKDGTACIPYYLASMYTIDGIKEYLKKLETNDSDISMEVPGAAGSDGVASEESWAIGEQVTSGGASGYAPELESLMGVEGHAAGGPDL